MAKKKRLLIIVDFQNDFVDGSYSFKEAVSIEPHLLKLISEFEDSKDDIVFTRDVHQNDYLLTEEGKHKPFPHCIEGSFGAEIYGEVGKISKKYRVFDKDTYGSRQLYNYLKDHHYDEVTLVGLISSICVLANAVVVKTILPDAHVIVDSLGVTDPDKEIEMKTFDVLRGLDVEIK